MVDAQDYFTNGFNFVYKIAFKTSYYKNNKFYDFSEILWQSKL